MSKINFGIVGCGRIALRHAENISKVGNLVAVCDTVIEKANILAKQYNAIAYNSLQSLLEKSGNSIDVIAICTPNGVHATHAINILEKGIHVIVEKPMALLAEDCLNMIKAAQQNKKHLFVVKQNRYNPPIVAVKKALEQNILGKNYSFHLSCFWNRTEAYYRDSWKGTKQLDGGVLYTQFSHFIDILLWYWGDVKKVHAIAKNYHHQSVSEIEDTGVVILEFENGIIGSINYTINSFEKNMEGSLTIFAENGTVKIGGQYLNELEYQNIKNFAFSNVPKSNGPNDYGNYMGSMSNHNKVYENVIDVLKNKAELTTPPEDGLKTVALINEIYNVIQKF